jgi:hypothetical protein
MKKKLNKIDKSLVAFNEANISPKALLLVSFCRQPRSYQDIEDSLGIKYYVAAKMVKRNPAFLESRKAKIISRERGDHPVEIESTEIGKELLKRIF